MKTQMVFVIQLLLIILIGLPISLAQEEVIIEISEEEEVLDPEPEFIPATNAVDRMVRLIYLVPNDREPQPDFDAKFDALIKETQRFFADEMERHGYGRKTFRFEADENGDAPVTLSYFQAENTDAGVVLKWTTESELDNAGFYIYRSLTKDGEFKVVNPTMIRGAGTTGERNEYTWTDTTAKPNTVYYYRIEDVSHAGEREKLATVRLRGFVSATGKWTTRWADLKATNGAH